MTVLSFQPFPAWCKALVRCLTRGAPPHDCWPQLKVDGQLVWRLSSNWPESGFTPEGHPVDSNSGPLTRRPVRLGIYARWPPCWQQQWSADLPLRFYARWPPCWQQPCLPDVCPVIDDWCLAPLPSCSEDHLQRQTVSDVCRQSSDDVWTADARSLTFVLYDLIASQDLRQMATLLTATVVRWPVDSASQDLRQMATLLTATVVRWPVDSATQDLRQMATLLTATAVRWPVDQCDSGFTPDGHPVDSNSGPLTHDSGFTPDDHLVKSDAPLPRFYATRPPRKERCTAPQDLRQRATLQSWRAPDVRANLSDVCRVCETVVWRAWTLQVYLKIV